MGVMQYKNSHALLVISNRLASIAFNYYSLITATIAQGVVFIFNFF